MQNWLFEPLDIYCERVGSGFWDEPLNAITNISFLLLHGLHGGLLKINLLILPKK